MPEGHTQPVHATHRHIRRTRQHELVVVDVVGFGGIVGVGVDAGSLVGLAGGELAQVLVGEFQVLGTKDHRTHLELGVDGDVQAFQVAVVDGQAGGYHAIGVVPEGHTEPVHAAHRHIRGARHHELIIGTGVGLGGVIGIGVDAGPFVGLTGGDLAQVLVGELQILGTKGHGTDGKLGVDGDIQAFQITIGDHQPGRAAMTKGHAELGHATHGRIGCSRHDELIAGTAVGFVHRVIRAGVDSRPAVAGTGWELAGVLVEELQVLGTKADRTHHKAGVDRQIQALQVAVDNHQARRGTMPKAHAELGHAAHRHVARAGHGKLVLGRVIRAGIGIGAGTERLAGVGVLELQILHAERDRTDHEAGVDRGIQNHQVSVGDHQAWAGAVPKPDTEAINAAHIQRCRSRHCKQVGGLGVLEPHAVEIEINRAYARVRLDRHIQVHQRAVLHHQAGRGGGYPGGCGAVAKQHAEVTHAAHCGGCRTG